MKFLKEKEREGYVCGRLFRILEQLQQEATDSSELSSERSSSLASTAPRSIFGELLQNAHVHINYIQQKPNNSKTNYSLRIQELLQELNSFPLDLDQKEKSEFWLGYYHE